MKPEDLIHEESPYNLTIVARDDGSCCGKDASELHMQTAVVIIGKCLMFRLILKTLRLITDLLKLHFGENDELEIRNSNL